MTLLPLGWLFVFQVVLMRSSYLDLFLFKCDGKMPSKFSFVPQVAFFVIITLAITPNTVCLMS